MAFGQEVNHLAGRLEHAAVPQAGIVDDSRDFVLRLSKLGTGSHQCLVTRGLAKQWRMPKDLLI